jgi:hypothetical protein
VRFAWLVWLWVLGAALAAVRAEGAPAPGGAPEERPEPHGAEDYGAQFHTPIIPEPMVFDLVRPLGARRGELEVNVLSLFPFGSRRRERATRWAPEIEYALFDGFAVELEFPFEDEELEAYKLALQGTFGRSADERFIHGWQTILEPDTRFADWELTGLYLWGREWTRSWSSLGMIGGRTVVGDVGESASAPTCSRTCPSSCTRATSSRSGSSRISPSTSPARRRSCWCPRRMSNSPTT